VLRERPKQIEGKISFPIYNEAGKIEVLSFDKDDPELDASDPRVIKYKGQKLSYDPVLSKVGFTAMMMLRFMKTRNILQFLEKVFWSLSELKTAGFLPWKMVFILHLRKFRPWPVGVGLIITKDFKTYERKGMIFPPHNKDCAIFEEKINGIVLRLASSKQSGTGR